MVSPAQAAANVRTATTSLARQMGLYANTGAGFSYGSLDPVAQIALTNALAEYVRANPSLFDTGATDLTNPVLSAQLAQNEQQVDVGGSFGDYVKEVGSNVVDAGNSVAGIGQGALTLAKWSSWLLPLAGVAFVAILLWGEYNKRRPPGPPFARA